MSQEDVEALRLIVMNWSSALLGMLVARGSRDLRWLESLAGADAAREVARVVGRAEPTHSRIQSGGNP